MSASAVGRINGRSAFKREKAPRVNVPSEHSEAVRVELPIQTVSEANCRDHWATKAKRVKWHRTTAWAMCPAFPLPCVVTLTRVAKRLLDDDNSVGSLKAIRDGVAQRLGVDDRSPLVKWRYAQEKGSPCVVVMFSEGEDEK